LASGGKYELPDAKISSMKPFLEFACHKIIAPHQVFNDSTLKMRMSFILYFLTIGCDF